MPNTKPKSRYDFSNPVVEVYRGVPVKRYSRVDIRVNVTEMRRIIDAKIDEGLTAREAIQKRRIIFPCPTSVIVPANQIYAKSH